MWLNRGERLAFEKFLGALELHRKPEGWTTAGAQLRLRSPLSAYETGCPIEVVNRRSSDSSPARELSTRMTVDVMAAADGSVYDERSFDIALGLMLATRPR